MIQEPLDRTKSRLRDIIRRRERDLPVADDEREILERALLVIEELEDALEGAERGY